MTNDDFFALFGYEEEDPNMSKSATDATTSWTENINLDRITNFDYITIAMAAAAWASGTGSGQNANLTMFLKEEYHGIKWSEDLLAIIKKHDGSLKKVSESKYLHTPEDGNPVVSTVAETYLGYSTYVRLAGPSTPEDAKEEGVDCHITTMHPAIIDELAGWFIEHCERRQHDGTVYMMAMTKDGPKFQPIGKGGADMIPENYTPAVREAFKRISKELVDEVPRGRLSVISGPPGTGKTYLIRGLLRNVKSAVFVVVPQQALAALLDPSGMAALVEFRAQMDEDPIVLILEDADDALAPRREGDTSTISSLLNLGDGIIGSAIDVRVVATTNRDHQEFDAAILRPGRLSTHVVVGDLDSETATAVFKRLTDKDDVLPACSLATVYQKAYDAGWQGGDKSTAPKRKMGFGG